MMTRCHPDLGPSDCEVSELSFLDSITNALASVPDAASWGATAFGGVAGGAGELGNTLTAEGPARFDTEVGTGLTTGAVTSFGVAGMKGLDSATGNSLSKGFSTLTDSAGRVSGNLTAAQAAVDSAVSAVDAAQQTVGAAQQTVGAAQQTADAAQQAVDAADTALGQAWLTGDDSVINGAQQALADAQSSLADAQGKLAEAQSGLADARSEADSALQAEQRAGDLQEKENKGKKWDCPILEAAAVTHTLLSLANGFQAPNRGDDLVLAASHLNTALRDLASASDTRGWVGGARDTYFTANETHTKDVTAVRDVDLAFKDQLIVQADQVLELRKVFAYVRTTIMLAQPVASAMNAAGQFNASTAFQIAVATTCLSTDTSHQGIQHEKASENANQFRAIKDAYDALPTALETATTGVTVTQVDSRDIERLRDFQEAALGSLTDSAKAVKDSLSRNVGNTHGAVCMASRDAVDGVQESRKSLLSKDSSGTLQKRSEGFGKDLTEGLNRYRNADNEAAGTLNSQIPPATRAGGRRLPGGEEGRQA